MSDTMSRIVLLAVLLAFTILLLVTPAHSTVTQWQNLYGGNGSSNVSSLQKTTDGYILVGSSTSYSRDGNSSIYVARITETGQLLWNRAYTGGMFSLGNHIASVTNGYLIAGTEGTDTYPSGTATVLKIDNSGNELWRQSIVINNSTYSEANYVLAQADGCVVAGYSQAENIDPQYKYTMFLAKILDNGTISWVETFPDVFMYRPIAVQNAANGFILAGTRYTPYDDIYSGFMAKISDIGSEEWLYQYLPGDYQSYFFAFQKVADDRYIAAGGYSDQNKTSGVYTVIVNGTGDIQQDNIFPKINAMATSLALDQDTVDLSGWVISRDGSTSIMLTKMWLNGTSIFAKGVLENSSAIGCDIKPDGYGNYVVAGNIAQFSGSNVANNTRTSIFVANINMTNTTVPNNTPAPTTAANKPTPAGDNYSSMVILLVSLAFVVMVKKHWR